MGERIGGRPTQYQQYQSEVADNKAKGIKGKTLHVSKMKAALEGHDGSWPKQILDAHKWVPKNKK